ncbi:MULTISPECIES: gluconeogenesis factor YvcK family protein [unclassified Halanaerobium]|uniref:gluconeogenesis factor YvcK family protein n=1 Tax=unclassified Halanaerobium TaxID=2641197 RepID=UPI000DF2BE37|nr:MULTISPECIES: gluconeogenesis factor YvcK family protein [unclassified Halanaerobium]RCW45690.1 putative cofD-like protein [Halanaerobium sp. MA284_MarDTE_T2]RCW88062.1 putative cofD-like protein [Halanaerobium sp. DL-01]
MNFWKWFLPGLGVKRWLFLTLLGMIILSAGMNPFFGFDLTLYLESILSNIITAVFPAYYAVILKFVGLFMIFFGIFIIYYSLYKIKDELNKQLAPNDELIDILYKKKKLKKGPEIVAFGGGTGLSNLLRGLKKYSDNITAVVTVADDGGSSGRLRDEMGILPPGDIRNCLVALADREPLMEKLFQYRFQSEGQLGGHSFGNLYIAAMTEVLGDFEEAVRASSKILAIRGRVLPASNEDIKLGAHYQDRETRIGESAIPAYNKKIEKVFLKPETAATTPEVLEAVKNAEIILIGPGSLYTSILPNLLIKGIPESLKKSSALKIYIANVMTQPGETDGYTAADHARAIIDHVGEGLFDYIIVNGEKGSAEVMKRYEAEGAFPVKVDEKRLKEMNLKIIEKNLLMSDSYLRHDPDALAEVIYRLYESR